MNLESILKEKERKDLAVITSKAELLTSGEIRLHLEEKCQIDTETRALEVFCSLNMGKTRLKNAVHLPKMPAPGPTLAGWGGWGLLVARWWIAHGPPQAKLGPRATLWPQLDFGPCTGKNAVQLPKNPAARPVLAGPSC